MSVGNDFFNLKDYWGGPLGLDPENPLHVRAAIELIIRTVADMGDVGGTLYISRIGAVPLLLLVDVTRGRLTIPQNIELHLAPGVVLVPVIVRGLGWAAGDAELEIQGTFKVPMGHVLPTAEWFQRVLPGAASRFDVAPVRFTSRWMERVHPEWWGAADPIDGGRPDDNEALDAALHAALHDRFTLNAAGDRNWLRPLVIELRSSYQLSRPWLIDRGTRPAEIPIGIELRGVPGGMETPTFTCKDGFGRGFWDGGAWAQTMLMLRDVESATLDDLRFDGSFNGSQRAAFCVWVYRVVTSPEPSGLILVRRCSFRNATDHLVRIGIVAGASSNSNFAIEPRDQVRFEGCVFNPSKNPWESVPVALFVGAPHDVSVEVRGCMFLGEALAMIHALSCSLLVANTQFRNRWFPMTLRLQSGEAMLHAKGPEGGVDIFLDQRDYPEPATLHAQDCRSTSLQFLATCTAASLESSGKGRDCLIVGLHHVRKTVSTALALRMPAAIHWRIAETTKAILSLMGCRFDGLYMGGDPAVIGFRGCGAVANLGAFFGRGSLDTIQVEGADVPGTLGRNLIVPRFPP